MSDTTYIWLTITLLIFSIGFGLYSSHKICTQSEEILEEQLKNGGCRAYKGYFDETK